MVVVALFDELKEQGVLLEGVILKPNMALPGLDCPTQDSVAAVAVATVECFLESVPPGVAGIAFLSGGQPPELATSRLNAMNARTTMDRRPWPMVFSFARALQQPALDCWHGKDAQIGAAQRALIHRARCNHAALHGEYDVAMEGSLEFSKAS